MILKTIALIYNTFKRVRLFYFKLLIIKRLSAAILKSVAARDKSKA